jgi:hypothetical protein
MRPTTTPPASTSSGLSALLVSFQELSDKPFQIIEVLPAGLRHLFLGALSFKMKNRAHKTHRFELLQSCPVPFSSLSDA